MQSGDRLVCAFVEDLPVGAQFTDWLLHITVVPWLRVKLPSERLARELHEHYVSSQPFTVKVQAETMFGYKKRKSVNLVAAPELMKLEGQTRRLLHAHSAWVVDEADHTRHGYRPHVTHQKTGRLHEGGFFRCDQLYIVEQKGDYKEVAAIVAF